MPTPAEYCSRLAPFMWRGPGMVRPNHKVAEMRLGIKRLRPHPMAPPPVSLGHNSIDRPRLAPANACPNEYFLRNSNTPEIRRLSPSDRQIGDFRGRAQPTDGHVDPAGTPHAPTKAQSGKTRGAPHHFGRAKCFTLLGLKCRCIQPNTMK